jgi:glycosyltransferase involved in cell wall biosynthesis
MKIGIYDKWLHSIGGGEKVATVMAEALASEKKNQVDLIASTVVTKKTLGNKMGANLSRVNLVVWSERSEKILSEKTSAYDLFINVSFMDHLPSRATKSLYYVHFPTPIHHSFLGFIKYETILPFLRKFLIIPSAVNGLEELDLVNIRAGKWLKLENRISFANIPQKAVVVFRIYVDQMKISFLEAVNFSSPKSKLRVLDKFVDQHNNILNFTLQLESKKDQETEVAIRINRLAKEAGMALVSLTVRDFRYFLFNAIKRFLPRYEMALYGSADYKPAPGLDTYDLFLANSLFTQKWVRKYWEKKSKVLYPPVETAEFRPGKKKKIILNVGRFFVHGHCKKQDVLIGVFKEMIEKGILKKDWELHLVGSVAEGEEHRKYLERLKKEARGWPIHFHLVASFNQLKKLYSQAKIYWHAAGFGENERKNPINFEHFGISTVEAMAAGAIPIVFNGGGQPEVVGDNQSGFLWSSPGELISLTERLINDKKLWNRISQAAQKRVKKYSRQNFTTRFLKLVKEIQSYPSLA